MTGSTHQSPAGSRRVWAVAAAQHGVIARGQLVELGFSRHAIDHRIAIGRLHPVARGVYAVGRPQITRRGRWMAVVLACGPGSMLSHQSAAALWGIASEQPGMLEVSVRVSSPRRQPGVRAHRRPGLRAADATSHQGIPVTSPVRTLIDLAARLGPRAMERAVNEADRLDLVDPEALRTALGAHAGERGVGRLRDLLDRRTFRLTASELERLFLPIVAEVGLPVPLTRQWVNGFEVDFHWPDLGFLVETDGLRYHRTPAQQARDRLRDQAHTAAGLTHLRFTHAQVRYEPEHVRSTLEAVAHKLSTHG
jgi:very-short-patch-repair endonuclease